MEYLTKPNTSSQGASISHHLPLAAQGNTPMDLNSLLLLGATTSDHQVASSHHVPSQSQSPQQLFAHYPNSQQQQQRGEGLLLQEREDNLPSYGESRPPAPSSSPQLLAPQQQLSQPYASTPYPEATKEQPQEYGRPSSGSNGTQLLSSPPPLYQQQQHQQQQQQQQHQHQQQQQQPPAAAMYAAPSPSLNNRVSQPQQYAAAARPLGSYPTIEGGGAGGVGRDQVQSLLEAYPNPLTESQKIVKMLEIIAAHMQEHHRRFDSFMANVEERLGSLEAAVSQIALNDPELAKRSEALSQRQRMEHERERDRERAAPRSPPLYASSPKLAKGDLKKKKKKKIVPEYEREISRSTVPDLGYRGDEVDEELARKLQAQFNAEAEIEALKKESITLSDEEYAQKLQGLYLRRDAAAGQTGRRGAAAPAVPTTSTSTAKKDAAAAKQQPDSTNKPEEKSLWSRLFGAPKNDSDDDTDDEDSKAGKKTEITTTYPAAASAVRAPSASQPPAAVASGVAQQGQQMMAVPYYYPGMPQQQYVIPQGMPQYAPYPLAMPQPGTQYLYPTPQPAPQPQ